MPRGGGEVCGSFGCWEDCASNMHCFNVVRFSESATDWKKASELCHRTGRIGPDGLGRLGHWGVGTGAWRGKMMKRTEERRGKTQTLRYEKLQDFAF